MDPNADPNAAPDPNDAAAAAADAGSGADPQPSTTAQDAAPLSPEDAFSAGVASVNEPATPAAPEAPAADPAVDPTKPPATPATPKPGDPPATPATPATDPKAPKPDPAVEAEMKELGIDKQSDRAQARFRELSAQVKELPELRKRAELVDSWVDLVSSTGADEQQFGSAIGYLRAVNSGDPVQMRKAYDQVLGEVQALGKALGLAAPGVDPLADHADLAKLVADGDLDRAVAEELVQRRTAERIQTASTTAAQQRQAAEQQGEQAKQQALQAVTAFGQRMRAADPLFTAKFQAIQPMVQIIQDTLPPAQWATAIERAYGAAVVAPAAPPAPSKPPPSNIPVRPSGASSAQAPQPRNREEAFSAGVDAARAAGQ